MKYLCYDSALNGVYTLLLLQKEYAAHTSLFKDTKDEKLWDVAPWIFALDDDAQNVFAKWNDDYNCSLKRCLIIETPVSLNELKIHLQQFIYKKTEGITYFNRFWDAAVLPKQLGRMNTKQLADFFEEIKNIYAHNGATALKYTLDKKDRLVEDTISIKQIFSGENEVDEEKTTEPSTTTPDKQEKPRRRFFTE